MTNRTMAESPKCRVDGRVDRYWRTAMNGPTGQFRRNTATTVDSINTWY